MNRVSLNKSWLYFLIRWILEERKLEETLGERFAQVYREAPVLIPFSKRKENSQLGDGFQVERFAGLFASGFQQIDRFRHEREVLQE